MGTQKDAVTNSMNGVIGQVQPHRLRHRNYAAEGEGEVNAHSFDE